MRKVKFIVAALALAAILPFTVLAKSDKVTICHAAGLEGTTKYVTLTISENAVYGRKGNAGHFNEDGTTRAGHEQDYFGPCISEESASPSEDEPTATPTPSVSPTPTPSTSESPKPTPFEGTSGGGDTRSNMPNTAMNPPK